MKILVQISIIILLSIVLANEAVKNRAVLLDALRQLNVAYNPLIKRSSRVSDDLDFYGANQQCTELTLPPVTSLIFLCLLIAFLGWKYSWLDFFQKSQKTSLTVQSSPPPHHILPPLLHLHQQLSGLLQTKDVPYPLTICPSLVPLVKLWSSRLSEQEEACAKYLDEHSDELEAVMRNVLDLIEERRSRLMSSADEREEEYGEGASVPTRVNRGMVHAVDLVSQPSSGSRKRMNAEISLPFTRQMAAPQIVRRTREAEEPIVEEPETSTRKSYVLIPRIKKGKKGRVMNIEIEFESEKEECACN